MNEAGQRETRSAKGCGVQAAIAFLIVVGVPTVFIFLWGLSPCAGGRPCDPNGARNLGIAALSVAGLAILVGLAVRGLVGWWTQRQAARGRDGWRQVEIALYGLLALGAAGMLYLVMG